MREFRILFPPEAFFHFFFFFFSFRSCLDLVLWYFFKLHNTYNTNIERAVFCIQYLLSTLTWQVVQYSSCAMESLFKSIMHLLSLWPPAPPPSSCTCRLYYFKKCAKPPNSKKNLSIMGVGATERFTKKITASFSMWLLSLSNHDFTFELTLIQLSFNLEDHIINDWRFIWKSNGKSSRKILAGRNKAPQLQPVPILLHNSCYSQDTHAETFGRKAFQVQSM